MPPPVLFDEMITSQLRRGMGVASPTLAGGPNAPGVSYSVNGKQYASVFAGGGAGKQSDVAVAFALP